MRARFALTVFMCVFAATTAVQAQDAGQTPKWTTSLVTNMMVAQTSYSDSWVGGEAGSVNWVWNLDGTAERPLSPKVNFKSTLRLKFGQTLTQDAETKIWTKPKKSTDLIDWENVMRFTLGGAVDPYAAFRLESQFFDGSVEAMKLYFSPLKLTESFGVARQFYKKENEVVISRVGLALRQIFKTSITSLAPVQTVDSTITDGGMESVTDATLKLAENITYVGKLSIFKALFSSQSGREQPLGARNVGVYWSSPDVNWENTLTAAVSKIVTVNLYTQVLYDKDIDKSARFKETLALGFTFRML
ncbi:MAG: DUF3078 domain-containing protein [candidate division Zixibacteria bacterium]|nr:DUF3078 domain-containing protein [candidate division Zixibacteria bacterium]